MHLLNASDPHTTPTRVEYASTSPLFRCNVPPYWLLKYRPPEYPDNAFGLLPYDLLLQFDERAMQFDSEYRWKSAYADGDPEYFEGIGLPLMQGAEGASFAEVSAFPQSEWPLFPPHFWSQWSLELTIGNGWVLSEGTTYRSFNDFSIPAVPRYSIKDPETGATLNGIAGFDERDLFSGTQVNRFAYIGNAALGDEPPSNQVIDEWRPAVVEIEPFWP
jgi:hypothetical protein